MAKFELKALITGVDKLSPQLTGIQKRIAGFRKGIESTGFGKMGFSDLVTGGAFAAPFIAGTKAAMDFESQMADVRKVVDFDTPEQFKQMGNDIIDMSKRLPMTAEGLAQIVAAAGQSGIAKKELARFAEEAAKMGIAFDITAEESGDMMAKWRTAFKMTQDEVVGLADKINYLGNNGAAKAKEISDLVTRIGPLGEVAGVSSAQIAALGSTIIGTGTSMEVASTGLKNFMLTLTSGASATNKQKAAFKSLRLSSAEVAKGMQADAEGTIKDILARVAQVDKTKQAALLTQLFGRESVGAIAPLLNNLDVLKKNLKMVGDQTQYAGSMQKEYEARAATTANSVQLLKNQVKAAAINLGNVFLPVVNDVVTAITPFVGMIGDLIRDNPNLVKQIAIVGATLIGAKLAVYGVTKALGLMSSVIKLSPMGILIRLIALGAGLIIANWKPIASFFKNLWADATKMFNEFYDYILKKIEAMMAAINNLTAKFKFGEPSEADWNDTRARMTGPAVTDKDYGASEVSPGSGIYIGPAPSATPPTMSTTNSIVNPQATKVNGSIDVNFNNPPPGTRVEQSKSNQGVALNVKQKVGRRMMEQ